MLASAVLLSVIMACLTNIGAGMTALGAGALLFALSPCPFRRAAKSLLAVNLFLALIWLTVPWSTPGPIIWQWHIFHATLSGTRLALLLTLKSNAILLVFLALVAPMPRLSFTGALLALKCPNRLALLLLMLERNADILAAQWRSLTEAARLRGFISSFSLSAYRVTASLLALLVVRASDRADKLHEAMLLRGFAGALPKAQVFTFARRDAVFVSLVLLLCLGLITLNYWPVWP